MPPQKKTFEDYWRRNVRLLVILLVIWAIPSFGLGIFFVEPLNKFSLGGFPLGFWFAQQGSIYIFVLLILYYALAMDRLDREFADAGEEASASTPGGES